MSCKNNNVLSIHNINSFNETLNTTLYEILNKYTSLIIDYIHFITENFINKNKNYTKFIIIRGLETITNVFNLLLFYTNS